MSNSLLLEDMRFGDQYSKDDGSLHWDAPNRCFLRPALRPHLNLPYLSKDGDLFTVDLPAQRVTDFKRCEEHTYDQVRTFEDPPFCDCPRLTDPADTVFSRQFIGPEDPRLFWTGRLISHLEWKLRC